MNIIDYLFGPSIKEDMDKPLPRGYGGWDTPGLGLEYAPPNFGVTPESQAGPRGTQAKRYNLIPARPLESYTNRPKLKVGNVELQPADPLPFKAAGQSFQEPSVMEEIKSGFGRGLDYVAPITSIPGQMANKAHELVQKGITGIGDLTLAGMNLSKKVGFSEYPPNFPEKVTRENFWPLSTEEGADLIKNQPGLLAYEVGNELLFGNMVPYRGRYDPSPLPMGYKKPAPTFMGDVSDATAHWVSRALKENVTPENVGLAALTAGAGGYAKVVPEATPAVNSLLKAMALYFGPQAGKSAIQKFQQGDIEGGSIDATLATLIGYGGTKEIKPKSEPGPTPSPPDAPKQLPWRGYPTPDAPAGPTPSPSMGNIYVAPGYEFTKSGAAVPAGTLPKAEAELAPSGSKIGRYRKTESGWMDSQTGKAASLEANVALEKNWAQRTPPETRFGTGLGGIPPEEYRKWSEQMMRLMQLRAQYEDQPSAIPDALAQKVVFGMIDRPDLMEVAGQAPVIPADAAPFTTEGITTIAQPGEPMKITSEMTYARWVNQMKSLQEQRARTQDPTARDAIREVVRAMSLKYPEYAEHASTDIPPQETMFNVGPGRIGSKYTEPLDPRNYRWYANMQDLMRQRQQQLGETAPGSVAGVGGTPDMVQANELLSQHLEAHPDYQHPAGSMIGDRPQYNVGLGPLFDPQAYQMYRDMLDKFQIMKAQYSDMGPEFDVRRIGKYGEKIAQLKESYPEYENIPRQPYLPPSQLRLNAGIPLDERTQDAIRELRPDSLFKAPPPRDLQEVGQEIRQRTTPEGAARLRQGEEVKYYSGAPIDPEDLRVAVRIGGEIKVGEPGDTHADVIRRYGGDELAIDHTHPDRGFVSVRNPTEWLSRIEAGERSGIQGTAHDGGVDSSNLPITGAERERMMREIDEQIASEGVPEPSPESKRRFMRSVDKKISRPYESGRRARAAGQTLADNPYVEGSTEEASWNRGFNEGGHELHAGVPFEEIRRLFRGTSKGDELGIKWFSTSRELAESYGAKAPKPEDVRGKVFDSRNSPDREAVFEKVQDVNPDVPMKTLREADPRYFEDASIVEELKKRGYKGMQTYFKGEPVIGMFGEKGIRPTINPRAGEAGFTFFPGKLIEDTIRKIRNFSPIQDVRKELTGKYEGSETLARVGAEQLANRVREGLRTSEGLKRGIANWKDEKKSLEMHRDLTGIVLTGTGDPRLVPYANQMKSLVNTQMAAEAAAGVDLPDLKTWTQEEITKNRFNPAKTDMTDMFQRRIFEGQMGIRKSQWINGLGSITAFDGRSITTPLVRGPGRGRIAPPGYKEVTIDKVRVAVHQDFAGLVKDLNSPSWLREFEIGGFRVGEGALKLEGALKHGLLAFDTFHMFRVLWRDAMLQGKTFAGRISVPGIPRYMMGKSLLEYDAPTIKRLVQNGDISPTVETWVNANRAKAEMLMKQGLNVGRITEGLYSNVTRKIPLLGRYNKWLFEKLSRGAMLQSAILEFDRIKGDNPSLSDVQVARRVARDINTDFGNLQRQSFIKNEGFRDAAFMVFLAPQWFESMVTREVKGGGQLAKGLVTGKTGTLGKAVGTGILAAFVLNQFANQATRGKFTWENEEENRKLAAYVPDLTGEGEGFWIEPLPEVSQVALNYMIHKGKEPIETVTDIFKNKLSPIGRATYIGATRTDYAGRKMGDTETLKEMGKSVVPTPIFLSGALSEIPGALQRQAVSSTGVRLEPYGRKEGLGKLTIDERVAEAKHRLETRVESYERRDRASMLSMRQSNERGKAAFEALSKADQGFIKSRNLLPPGYENTITVEGVKIPLIASEERRLKELIVKSYSDAMAETIRPDLDSYDKEDQKPFFNRVMARAHEQARDQLIDEMQQRSDSMVESNRLRKYKTPALSPR